jgi:effector-binding domain-containing protein
MIQVFCTSLFQIFGNFYSAIKHNGNLPSFENYITKNEYILPFSGKWTVINGGVDEALSHSWEIFSQRYAYDFFILDDDGKSLHGDPSNVENYYCYGKDIIAPADGVIVKACDKYINSRVDGEKVYCDAADLRGNHIIIKHDNNVYSVIAHLAPGSVTVKIGDKVKQGEKIAKRIILPENNECLCGQIMHIGSYDTDSATIEALTTFIENSGYVTDISDERRHHEIYLSDPRRTAIEKMKTVIRYPIKSNCERTRS